MKAFIFGADGFEDVELIYPYHLLKEKGITKHIASMNAARRRCTCDYKILLQRK